MPSPHCYGSLQVCRLRVAQLTSGGAPDPGADNGYVSDALVTVNLGIELDEGDDLTLKNGCGDICQTFKGRDTIKRVNLDMELCQLDAELISLLTGATLFTDGSGDALGFQFPSADDAEPDPVSLEVWSKAWDGAQQAVDGSSNALYWHWVFPSTSWNMGDTTLENDILRVPVTGNGIENDQITSNGPYDDWPSGVISGGGVTTAGGVFLDSTIPDAACGFIEVPAQTS